MPEESKPKTSSNLHLSLDYRVVVIVLLAVIAAMFLMWRPWQNTNAADRTVEVTGQTTLSARPDEFVFYPTYEFSNADKQAALNSLSAKSNELITKLKALGVADKDIKTNSSNWSSPIYKDGTNTNPTYTLSLTVTTSTEALAQKVQDYLVTTAPSGSVSPQANFSDQKRKELEDKARDEASKDARKKAEQSARNLGFKLAAVKTVNDGAGFGGYPMPYATDMRAEGSSAPNSLSVQPGENDLTYTVTVTYFIR